MKQLKVVLFFIVILFSINVNIFGASSANTKINVNNSNIEINKQDNNIINVEELTSNAENFMDELVNILDIIKLKNIEFQEMMLNPLMLFWIFIKAFIIVILINFIAKLICKFIFNASSVIKSRMQSRKLNKVLRDLYY